MKLGIVCVLSTFLMGCASTPWEKNEKFYKESNSKIKNFPSPTERKFMEEFEAIADSLGSTVVENDSYYGKQFSITKELDFGGSFSGGDAPKYWETVEERFSQTCEGQVAATTPLEIAIENGLIDPLKYVTREELRLMKENYTSINAKTGLKRYLSSSRSFEWEIDESNIYYGLYPTRKHLPFGDRKLSVVCISEGVPVSILHAVTKVDNFNTLNVFYFPQKTSNNVLKDLFKTRKENLDKVLAAKSAREEREAQRIEREKRFSKLKDDFIVKQKAEHKLVNEITQNWWDTRTASWEDREVGDRICSYKGNKMGFVEQVAGDKIKVFWKGYVVEDDGFFFGNMPFHVFSKSDLGVTNYTYTKISDTTWVSLTDVGSCVHEL